MAGMKWGDPEGALEQWLGIYRGLESGMKVRHYNIEFTRRAVYRKEVIVYTWTCEACDEDLRVGAASGGRTGQTLQIHARDHAVDDHQMRLWPK